MKKPLLSIILPSYKEEDNLKIILLELIDACQKLCHDRYQIIVVDSVEPLDNTATLCKELSRKEYNVLYIQREKGNEYGNAIRTGIKYASGRHVVFMDADGSHSPEFLEKLYQNKEKGDVIIASRYIKSGDNKNPGHLVALSKILNIFCRLFLNIPCMDISNSYKMYRLTDLKNIELKCDHLDIIEEILYKVYKSRQKLGLGCQLVEIPFIFNPRRYGRSKRNLFLLIINYLKVLIALKFNLI